MAVLMQEGRRLAKGVDELRDATGGRMANIYEFACGSVAYFTCLYRPVLTTLTGQEYVWPAGSK